jgi:hypothetical protein
MVIRVGCLALPILRFSLMIKRDVSSRKLERVLILYCVVMSASSKMIVLLCSRLLLKKLYK